LGAMVVEVSVAQLAKNMIGIMTSMRLKWVISIVDFQR